MEVAVLVPIKSFGGAKGRLAGHLGPGVRADLARAMAERVLAAAAPFPAFVVCDDESVAAWSIAEGADVLWTPGLGLNGAVDRAVEMVADRGAEHVVIAHSDLPLATSFAALVHPATVTLVPDFRFDGTNVLARPVGTRVPASYGAGSFRHHLNAALDGGHPVRVVTDRRLGRDVDTIDDCRDPEVMAELADVLGAALASSDCA